MLCFELWFTTESSTHAPTVKRIPDELWDEIRMILPPEKLINTIECPIVSFFRKVINGIIFVLSGRQWKVDVAKRTWFRFNTS